MYVFIYLLNTNTGDDMFKPSKIYYEENINDYELGKMLLSKYLDVPKEIILNHNNIESLRKNSNKDFIKMKNYLIIGTRKTQRFVPNYKSSDYLVPYTSSGCSAFCLYCYLVCNYNKCSYLRLFVNRDEMFKKIVKVSLESEKELTFEIGSNSDLVLENTITGNLEWTIEKFGREGRGFITFPTKFDMIDSLLSLKHNNKTIIRMSVNPSEIIKKIEFGTSSLEGRVKAINKLVEAGYKVGIIVAPIILLSNYKRLYSELFLYLDANLTLEAKKNIFFEFIFMTYSYVHRVINEEALPNSINLYNRDIMTGRGRGKYAYRESIRNIAEEFLMMEFTKYFSSDKIIYIV